MNKLSIPTHVGKTHRVSSNWAVKNFNPHTRGENVSSTVGGDTVYFQSPHTWGKPVKVIREKGASISIPTHVGKTKKVLETNKRKSFNPHTRGENGGQLFFPREIFFQSPHTWGKRRRVREGEEMKRASLSIPTHVGKTATSNSCF